MQLGRAKTIVEPFRIKVVEPLPQPTYAQRVAALQRAKYNLFTIPADLVTFDLLTDSGTSAMSAKQWAGIMQGDESYAGAQSYYRFAQAVGDLTGMRHVIPTHQGRSAEHLLMRALLKPGQIVIGNTHFDTTRANIETAGGEALDLPSPDTRLSQNEAPFKGNIDLSRLRDVLQREKPRVAAIIMTITNNSVGGQPVSLENMRGVRALAQSYGVPLFIDCARFAENAYFIKLREAGQSERSVRAIAEEMFRLGDGALMSMKKDAFGNMGGFLALQDDSLAEKVRSLMVITEGFPTYGGLAGRDMEALAVGLEEVTDEAYLAYRIRSVEYFAQGLIAQGYEVVRPPGGHAVYIDAGAMLPQIPPLHYPGQALSVALYEGIGMRGVEVGTVMLGHKDPHTGLEQPAPQELVRLALPRRVYTQSHVDYMIEMAGLLRPHLERLRGYRFTYEPAVLRHFTGEFTPL